VDGFSNALEAARFSLIREFIGKMQLAGKTQHLPRAVTDRSLAMQPEV
jgi:hypothetical protein